MYNLNAGRQIWADSGRLDTPSLAIRAHVVPRLLLGPQLLARPAHRRKRNFGLTKVTLYKVNPELSYSFLSYLDRHELSKPIYNDYQHQNAKITIYNNLTGLVLAKATRESTFRVS